MDWPIPNQRQGSRWGRAGARRQGGKLGPREGILYQTVSRLPVANQVFLGSWKVDICQEGHSQRSAPQGRHTAHLRQHSHCAPRKPSNCDRGRDKMLPGECVITKHLVACLDLGRAQNACPTESVPLWST